MTKLSHEAIWRMTEKEFSDFLDKGAFLPRSRKIHFYAPSFMFYKTDHYYSSPTEFPTISVTGKGCALRCKHCGGVVLDTMYPATTPEKLFQLSARLRNEGASGCLISGGCLPDGSVPIGKFIPTLEQIKQQLGLTLFVHTGIIDTCTAEALKKAGVDAVLIDIIGSQETIKEIYNLKMTVPDYADSLRALNNANISFIPHVIVGLHYGKLKGELHALKMISQYKPSAMVIIAFMPIHNTEMEHVKPPEPTDIAKVIAAARLLFPKTPLALGCMRPKGEHRTRTDILAIKCGVDAIAFPTEQAIEFAESQGLKTSFSSMCCAHAYVDLKG